MYDVKADDVISLGLCLLICSSALLIIENRSLKEIVVHLNTAMVRDG